MLTDQDWGTQVQKDMVLDCIWRRFPAGHDAVRDALLPIAVGNRSLEVLRLLLRRGADICLKSKRSLLASSALQQAISQNSRELV